MSTQKTWFITGCSTGFGRILSELVLKSGDRLIATARNASSLETLKNFTQSPDQLLTLALDVNDSAQIKTVVSKAAEHMGRIDVLVNNAGYGYVGALEEVAMTEVRKVFDTNVFALMEVTQAIIPLMRTQKSGHIINLSSVAGMVGTPGAGIYNATKFAVEGLSEALSMELAHFGIKVTIIEPGAFRTDFANRSLHVAPYMPEYQEALAVSRKYYETIGGQQPGDPNEAAKAMIEITKLSNPPLRLVMGKIALGRIRAKLDQYLKEIATFEKVTLDTDYPTSQIPNH
jgi:short-subunit dehydrogenase